ncbi:MAG: PepSY-associated TM helix domain-containing protein [Aureliella sp.]
MSVQANSDDADVAVKASGPERRRSLYAISAAWFRWIHIYVSMLSFAALMFFAITGITLNHPTWLGGSEQTETDHQGDLPAEIALVVASDSETVDKLRVAEWFRREFALRGQVTEFEVDEYECMVVFKGAGYSADVFVDRELSSYMLTETQSSFVAVLNDLHKGRDTGIAWKWLIDISAIVMVLMSLSGFGLLLYLKKRRRNGILVAVAGTVVLLVVWMLVP